MNRMPLMIFCFIAVMLLSHSAIAQFDNVGTSAAAFLKIGVGSRAVALGGAYTAIGSDPSSLYWNVAGIAAIERNEIMLSHNEWIKDLDINHDFLGAVFPLGKLGVMGLSVTYLSMGKMKVTTLDQPQGTGETFSAFDAAVGLAYARRLTDRFSVGIQGKYVVQHISESDATGFGIDVGGVYDTGMRGLKIGMAIKNFGTKMRMQGRDQRVKVDPFPTFGSNPEDVVANLETASWPLPLSFQMGASINAIDMSSQRVTLGADYKDERDFRPLALFGVEYAYKEFFFLRAGTNKRYERKNRLNLGAGIHTKIPSTELKVQFDYSYSDLNRLSSAHRISVGLAF